MSFFTWRVGRTQNDVGPIFTRPRSLFPCLFWNRSHFSSEEMNSEKNGMCINKIPASRYHLYPHKTDGTLCDLSLCHISSPFLRLLKINWWNEEERRTFSVFSGTEFLSGHSRVVRRQSHLIVQQWTKEGPLFVSRSGTERIVRQTFSLKSFLCQQGFRIHLRRTGPSTRQ